MSATPNLHDKPRDWEDLRHRVLNQGYLEIGELERRRRRAHQMKYAIWLVPLAIVGVAPTMILDGWSWLAAGAIVLICSGAISAHRLGARWEMRWDEVIRERSARN